MGRGKLKLGLIAKARQRMMTFKKRKDSLKKKVKELTSLCGVNACMIAYGPDSGVEAEIYPNNLNETCRVIAQFNSKRDEWKSFGLSDYLPKEKMEVKVKYPTWNETLNSIDDPVVMRNFAHELNAKAQIVKSRILMHKQQIEKGSGSAASLHE